MQKISVIVLILISITSYGQKGNNKLIAEYEDTLKKIIQPLMNGLLNGQLLHPIKMN